MSLPSEDNREAIDLQLQIFILQKELDCILPHIKSDTSLCDVIIILRSNDQADPWPTRIEYFTPDQIAPSFIVWLVRRASHLSEQIKKLETELAEINEK